MSKRDRNPALLDANPAASPRLLPGWSDQANPEKMGLYLGKVQKRPKCDTRRVHGKSFLRKELESPRKGRRGVVTT